MSPSLSPYLYTYIYIYVYTHYTHMTLADRLAASRNRRRSRFGEKWEVLLGIRLLGTTFWCGLSNHQAATEQMRTWQNRVLTEAEKISQSADPPQENFPLSPTQARARVLVDAQEELGREAAREGIRRRRALSGPQDLQEELFSLSLL